MTFHKPNAASGGRPSPRLEVGDFLSRNAHKPQQAALLQLISTLVDKINEGGLPI